MKLKKATAGVLAGLVLVGTVPLYNLQRINAESLPQMILTGVGLWKPIMWNGIPKVKT